MRIAHLAASTAAAGVLVLAGAAAPAFATDDTPTTTATVTDTAEPTPTDTDTAEPTPTDTDTAEPTPTPTETEPAPEFDADITPHTFSPGDRLTLTTSGCPVMPTVEDVDGLFTSPLVLKEVGERQHQGSAVTKTNLSPTKVYHVIVTCPDVRSFTFFTTPGKTTTKHPSGQTGVVPVGGVQTGDGSSLGGGSGLAPTLAAGGVALAAMTALTVAYRRRKAREDA